MVSYKSNEKSIYLSTMSYVINNTRGSNNKDIQKMFKNSNEYILRFTTFLNIRECLCRPKA